MRAVCRRLIFSAHGAVTGHKFPKKFKFFWDEPKKSVCL
jgi:hypothetical protein